MNRNAIVVGSRKLVKSENEENIFVKSIDKLKETTTVCEFPSSLKLSAKIYIYTQTYFYCIILPFSNYIMIQ